MNRQIVKLFGFVLILYALGVIGLFAIATSS